LGASRLRGLLLAIFVSAMPATIVLPMLPSLGEELGVGNAALGLMFGVYPLTSVLAAPVWGRLSDRFGRKPAMLGSLAGTGLAFVAFGYVSSFEALFVVRALQGLAGSARGIGFAVIADTSRGEERAAGMGYVSASMALAFTVGPLLGAAFMGEDPSTPVRVLRELAGAPATGFDHLVPSLFGALLNAIAFGLVLLNFEETLPARRNGPTATGAAETVAATGTPARPDRGTLLPFLANAAVLVLIAQFALSGIIQGTVQFSFTLLADTVLGWTAQQVAMSLAAMGLGFVLATGVFMRPLLRRFSALQVMLAGVVLDVIGMLIFLTGIESGPQVITGLFISSFGGGFWATMIVGMISRQAPPEHQGVVLGIANGASLIGRVAGPPFAGLAAEAFGPRAPFVAILGCLALILAGAARRAARQRATSGSAQAATPVAGAPERDG
jgi:MFS family permease